MTSFALSILVAVNIVTVLSQSISALNITQDANLNFTGLTRKYGYSSQVHTIVTEDGYLLNLFRITTGRKKNRSVTKGFPVLMLHGLFDTSDTWIISGPGRGLAYNLADAGYDVWCGNVRGNRYSRAHTNFNPDVDDNFWKYSFDEIGYYDVPAMIDYILNTTNNKALSYIGHSQGTLTFFVLCSMRPEYNAKIKLSIALAPIAWLSNLSGPVLKSLSGLSQYITGALSVATIGEIFSKNSFETGILQNVCMPDEYCRREMLKFLALNDDNIDANFIYLAMGHVPSGSSVQNLEHFAQLVRGNKVNRYDYGAEKNIAVYGTEAPPEYDFSNVTAPVALFCGDSDWLSTPADVVTLRLYLKNVIDHYTVPVLNWNHLHHVWAKNAPKFISERVLSLIEKYS